MSAPGPVRKTDAENTRTDWRTPQWLFDHYNRIFDFQIDAAASEENKLCENYYGLDNGRNALEIAWEPKRHFLNPPYGAQSGSSMLTWAQKVTQEMADLHSQPGFSLIGCGLLVPMATGTQWWRHLFRHAEVVYAIGPSRVPFIHPETGLPVAGNTGDSSFIWINTIHAHAEKAGVPHQRAAFILHDIPQLVERSRKPKK